MTKELTNLVLEQPKTGFLNRAKSAFSDAGQYIRNGVLMLTGAAMVAGAVAGCQMPGIDKPTPPNYAPKAVLQVSNSGSNYRIHLTGEDPNGNSDIKQYKAIIDYTNPASPDETITQSSPIDVNRDLTQTAIIKGQVTDSQGATDMAQRVVSPGPDYLDISGILLQENDNDSNQGGVVEFYDTKNSDGTFSSPLRNKDTGLYQSQINAGVPLSVTLDKLVDPTDKVYLRAISGTSSLNSTSYARTLELTAVDKNVSTDSRANPAVRVVLYPTNVEGFDATHFKNLMAKTNFSSGKLQKFPSTYINNFNGGVIIKNNPLSAKGSFTEDQISKIDSKRDDIAKWYEKSSMNPMEVRRDNVTDADINFYLSNNYLVIEPDKSLINLEHPELPVYGESSPGLIRLNSTYPLSEYVLLHEAGHASSVAPFESNNLDGSGIIISYPDNVMNTNVPLPNDPVSLSAAKANLKAIKLVNETTYQSGEDLADILGN